MNRLHKPPPSSQLSIPATVMFYILNSQLQRRSLHHPIRLPRHEACDVRAIYFERHFGAELKARHRHRGVACQDWSEPNPVPVILQFVSRFQIPAGFSSVSNAASCRRIQFVQNRFGNADLAAILCSLFAGHAKPLAADGSNLSSVNLNFDSMSNPFQPFNSPRFPSVSHI